jgi:deoxyribodipyrimidine photolyase
MVVDFRQGGTANALTQANQINNAKVVSYNRARDMPQVKMFKIS